MSNWQVVNRTTGEVVYAYGSDDPRTVAGLNALEPVLVSQGIVSAGWSAGVVA